MYSRKAANGGRLRSNAWYFFAVLSFLQPFALKNKEISHRLTSIDMFSNYLKIAYRNLVGSKGFTLINIIGLAIGIAGFVVMATYVSHELSYDRFHSKAERIVRVNYQYEAGGADNQVSMTPFPLKPLFLNEYPGVEKVVRFYSNGMDASTLQFADKHFTEDNILFADPEVFQVFDFELEKGNRNTALSEVNSIVMTAGIARKYFGDQDPIGKIIRYKNDDNLKVTGIIKEVPENSHITFEILVPMELQRQRWIRGVGNNGYDFEQDWNWSGAWQYVLLSSPEAIPAFNAKLNVSGQDFFGRNSDIDYHFHTQPITSIHLHSDMRGEMTANGNISQVYGFGVIALLILLIACINFVNLSTARAARRAKEVGLRKVMGAYRSQLVGQFIAESVMITLLAAVVAVFMIEAMLPYFNLFMDKSLEVPYWDNPVILPLFVLGAVAIGFLAGVYPAFYMSRYRPVKTLKGNTTTGSRGNARLRKVLVTSQFIISNLLIIGILVVQQQLNYIKNKDLGFDKEQVIVLKHGNKLDEEYPLLSSELSQLAAVAAVNRGYVAGTRDWTQSFEVNGEKPEAAKQMGIKHVGFEFLEMFDMELLAGRNFQRVVGTDWRKAIMLNETAVKSFGWTNEEALGKTFSYVGGSDNRTQFNCKVIGVVKDAHLESLYQPIRPSVFKLASWGDVSVKLNAGTMEETRTAIAQVEAVWEEIQPDWPFEFEFLDQAIAAQYLKEERLGQTIQYFTILAIFIASLGLFGLASYTVQERTREIGVRKVLGASIASILGLVGQRFVGLISLSFIISIPLGWYLAGQWLQDFEYRVSVGVGVFLIAGLASMLVAGLAIGGQSLRAASINPVKTLRHE
jgi:putative ABC transport system permease protein